METSEKPGFHVIPNPAVDGRRNLITLMYTRDCFVIPLSGIPRNDNITEFFKNLYLINPK